MDFRFFSHIRLVLPFILVFLVGATSSLLPAYEDSEELDDLKRICKFERLMEVERECARVVSSASKAQLGIQKFYEIAKGLSFQNGDWVQEASGVPLMPFDSSDMPMNFSGSGSLLKLASFWVMGFNLSDPSNNAIGVCGLLSIGITRNSTLPDMPQTWYPKFHKSPGYSVLTIAFEGHYVESEDEGGQGLLCMLGNSVSPFSESPPDFSTWSLNYGCKNNRQFSPVKDDRIMLVLQYPQSFTLTSGTIVGDLRSLNRRSDPKYFDDISIVSRLSHQTYDSSYQFISKKIVSKACNSDLYEHESSEKRGDVYHGNHFCRVLQNFASEKFDIVVENCNSSNICENLGPFVLGEKVESKDNIFHKFRLMMTDLRCALGDNISKLRAAKVSAFFRVISPLEDVYYSGARSGISGMTISAEGTWNPSYGQLCMIGCVGLENDINRCNSKISLVIPVILSITQRSILMGTITNIQGTDAFSPLLFEKKVHPSDIWNRYHDYSRSYLSYKYSKIDLANDFWMRSKKFNIRTVVHDLIFKYPSTEDRDNLTLLSSLSSKLSFHVNALPDHNHEHKLPGTLVYFEILTLGKLFGRYWSELTRHDNGELYSGSRDNFAFTDEKLPLNVSAHLTLSGENYGHISKIYLEGLYDQLGGKMYLIGCKEIDFQFQHSERFAYENLNLGSKMDCLIEVMIGYSPETARWLRNPTAKISISSARNAEDPLYFRPIRLKTFLIPYTDNSKEVRFRRNFEELLRVSILLGSISCLFSQLWYMKKNDYVIPFISLLMLTIQVLVYCLPLVMNTIVLIKWSGYHYRSKYPPYKDRSMHFKMLEIIKKSLLLVAVVLALRLCRKVWKSRQRTQSLSPLDHGPREIRVFFASGIIHMIGVAFILVIRELKIDETMSAAAANHKATDWETILQEHWSVVQDWFLLPQIMGNLIWQIQVKPLSKVYYIGLTLLRFLLRTYDYMRDPVFNPYFHPTETCSSTEVFSRFEKIVIIMISLSFAVIVHVQQSGCNIFKV
ncbi:uncharacterized protein LOC113767897 [Coffea eugenioides]|uniref:uncharacterized protein LOC113767897 n=1 Tax=Coffea eugenioides TaxID=49369 RepID=UPI000F60FC1D|nr:uncharacterized protein LOC113767897 [Coffea eugenioides]